MLWSSAWGSAHVELGNGTGPVGANDGVIRTRTALEASPEWACLLVSLRQGAAVRG